MRDQPKREPRAAKGKNLRIAAYLLAVILVYSTISLLCRTETTTVLPGADGVVELESVDFGKTAVIISTDAAFIYEGAFYMPEDFSMDRVTQEGVRITGKAPRLGDYGTVRFTLRLLAGKVYAISALSAAYAQRLFINGEGFAPIGVTGDGAESVIPKVARYTETFQPLSGTTEIILHYSNFVHPDSGYLYPLSVGYTDPIARVEQTKAVQVVLITGTLLTAMLFFFGLYLFAPENLHLLWFSLVCGSIALRGLLVKDMLLTLLMPDLSWYAVIRLKYLAGCGLVLFSALYLSALFRGAISKRISYAFLGFCLCNAIFFTFFPPLVFARLIWGILTVCIVYFSYALVRIFFAVFRKGDVGQLSVSEQTLLLPGVCLYLALSALEIYAHENVLYLGGLDFAQVGMLLFLFLNILALLMQFSRTRQELSRALQREREMSETNRMLERLDRAKTDFLGNISHEMKTPLAVMSNCAGLTLNQLRLGRTNEETEENLDMIQRESVRLGRLVEQLMKVSLEKERQLALTDTDAGTLLGQARNLCSLFCREKGNRIIIKVNPEHLPIRVNTDGLFHVLINLLTNANRHTRGGNILLSASETPDGILFEVSDSGEGIAPELFTHVLDRGISGSGSSGLGLPIAKEIVEEHGGTFEIESGSKGVRASFLLPHTEGGMQA